MDLKLLNELGLTKEQIETKIIDRIANDILYSKGWDGESDDEYTAPTQFKKKLEKAIELRLQKLVDKIADRVVKPNFEKQIEELCFQKTNQWGEVKGEKITFREWLEKAASSWMSEPVNYEGKSKAENTWSSFNASTTRLAYMIDKHLHYTIETAMKGALKQANESIADGLKKAVEMKIGEIASAMKLAVKVEGK